ncbi:hypothetical protein Vse01_05120 [Micromonospora sediminimaris]|uniref:Uncharacterized protein n=1 Tax=Micromonospora sediminimaris TaxID=547162 RepID=A0A9W5ULJ2_9ACTN|nr:hypothetical protein Vse01_05120 [Micromonospora sediminimaris]
MLRDHLVTGALPVAELVAAGTVTTDYRAGAARIHVINEVLGDLPTTAGQDDDGRRTRVPGAAAVVVRAASGCAVSAARREGSSARRHRCRPAAGGRSWSPGR